MDRLRVLYSRLRAIFDARRLDRDLDEELRGHIEMETEANIRRGMTPAQARRAALLEFGGVAQTAELYRDSRGLQFVQTTLQDIRYALRGFRNAKGFTAAAVISLALGIGVNTVIFSMINMLLLRPLPVANPSQLVRLQMQQKGSFITPVFSYPDYRDIREQASSVFSDVLAYRTGLNGLASGGSADRIVTHFVSGNYFTMLGLKPAAGRLILPSEGRVDGADPVIVLGYSYWQTRFAGDPNVVARKVLVDGHPMTIVGVAPKDFHGVQAMIDVQGYLPMSMNVLDDFPSGYRDNRGMRFVYLLGRLKVDVDFNRAQSVLNVVAARLSAAYPKDLTGVSLQASRETLSRVPGASEPVQAASIFFLALAIVVLVLACLNVTNLLIVRTSARQKEIAMRAALGGSRGRLIRQLLTESMLLALFGGALGLLAGAYTCDALTNLKVQGIPLYLDFGLDSRVLAYGFFAALLSGLLLGILPAWRASRAGLNAIARESGRRVTPRRQRLRSAFVIAQIAGSLVLLVIAGLFGRSLQNTRRLDLGFEPRNLVNLSLDPHEAGYNEERGRGLFKDVLHRVKTIPGVEAVSFACCGPIGAAPMLQQIQIDGYVPPKGQAAPTIFYNQVSNGFFETMRIPILRGRGFTANDKPGSTPVAIVNQNMAAHFWPGGDAIGHKFQFAAIPGLLFQIVGVARDGKYTDVNEPPMPHFYVSLEQLYFAFETLSVRSTLPPETVIAEVRKEIGAIAPGLPVFSAETMLQQLNGAHGYLGSRLTAWLAIAVGMLALALAVVGLYGVVSYAAVQRTHEIGVRMTLGARASEIRKMILGQGLLVVGGGIALGVLLSLAASPIVRGFMVGVSATDPIVVGGIATLLGCITLLACYVPAHRAMSVDPMVALRHD